MSRIPEPFTDNDSSPEAAPSFYPENYQPDTTGLTTVILDDAYNSGNWNGVNNWTGQKVSGQRTAAIFIFPGIVFSGTVTLQVTFKEYCNGIWIKTGSLTFTNQDNARAGLFYNLQEIADTVIIAVTKAGTGTITAGTFTLYLKSY